MCVFNARGMVARYWQSSPWMATLPAGLYLPTSDVDAVVVNSGCADVPAGLKALAQSLLRKKLAKNVQVWWDGPARVRQEGAVKQASLPR